MKKLIYPLSVLFSFGNIFSQSITVTGSAVVDPNSVETYYASFDYSPNAYTTLTWNVVRGTIISQSVNPTIPDNVYCVVQWDDVKDVGSVSLYDDLVSVEGNETVDIGEPSLYPPGPITYYNEYEVNYYTNIYCTNASSYQWYKNGSPIIGATNSSYSIDIGGINVFTDYYYAVTPGGMTNVLTFNYHGCDEPSDFPVVVPGWPNCASYYPLTLTQPNLGTGTTYTWNLDNGTYFSFSNQSNNTIQLNLISTPIWPEGNDIITKALAPDGTEIHMLFYSGVHPGCNSKKLVSSEDQFQKPTISPNPATSRFRITCPTEIQQLEIYNSSGILLKRLNGNRSFQMTVDIVSFLNGVYLIKQPILKDRII